MPRYTDEQEDRMTDMGNAKFERFTGDSLQSSEGEPGEPVAPAETQSATPSDNARLPIGVVLEISGAGSQVAFDLPRIQECMEDD
ncbi:MAG: hypothetical protein ABJ311_12655, partial [Erythrobacter sp.]